MLRILFIGMVLGGSVGIVAGYLIFGFWFAALGWAGAFLGAIAGVLIAILRNDNAKALDGAASEHSLQLREEVLDIHKERVQTGEVTVRKEVVEEQRTIQVPVRREEVVIEMKNEEAIGGAEHLAAETIRIPVREERVDVVTHPVDLEAVTVTTRSVGEMQNVHAKLKREEAKVEAEGEPIVISDGLPVDPEDRKEQQQQL